MEQNLEKVANIGKYLVPALAAGAIGSAGLGAYHMLKPEKTWTDRIGDFASNVGGTLGNFASNMGSDLSYVSQNNPELLGAVASKALSQLSAPPQGAMGYQPQMEYQTPAYDSLVSNNYLPEGLDPQSLGAMQQQYDSFSPYN